MQASICLLYKQRFPNTAPHHRYLSKCHFKDNYFYITCMTRHGLIIIIPKILRHQSISYPGLLDLSLFWRLLTHYTHTNVNILSYTIFDFSFATKVPDSFYLSFLSSLHGNYKTIFHLFQWHTAAWDDNLNLISLHKHTRL